MITLPPLKIQRSEFREVEVTAKIQAWLEAEQGERAEGIHASDLLDIRRAFFNRVHAQPITEKQTMFFSIGKVLHYMVLNAWKPSEGEDFATDGGTKTAHGILYSPDSEREDLAPIELKSSRSQREPSPEKLQDNISSYLEQLGIYMVLNEVREGELWILYLSMLDKTGRSHPTIRCYIVTLTDAQFELIREEVFSARDQLKYAIDKNDASGLPNCRTWLCGVDMCPHWEVCKPEGRYGKTTKKSWTA